MWCGYMQEIENSITPQKLIFLINIWGMKFTI
jgi:hypothetical protein